MSLMLGTACCTGAAAADLLKEGTFADTFYGFESVKGTGVGKAWYGNTLELDAIVIGNGFVIDCPTEGSYKPP